MLNFEKWRTITNGGAPKASPQHHYETMSVGEIIAKRPVLAEQAHVYLWCVAQHVDWAYEVARAWDCEPIIVWTWRKPGAGTGRFQCNTEHVLVARRMSREELRSAILAILLDSIARSGREIYELTDEEIEELSHAAAQAVGDAMEAARRVLET